MTDQPNDKRVLSSIVTFEKTSDSLHVSQNVIYNEQNEQPAETRAWSRIIPFGNTSDFLYSNQNIIYDEQNEQPAEARAWSTYQSSDSENVLSEGPTRQQKAILSSTLQDQQQRPNEDHRGVEHILSYVDRRRPPRLKKYRLTWRTFIGTMSGMEQIYARDDFLRYYKEFRPAFIFADSVFRGIGQVMFANNPLSGIIITVGLFIGNWELALYGLLGTCVSTLTAHVLGFTQNSIRAGLYGYNGCLTAMGISYFSFPHSPQMIGPVVIMCIFSAIFAMGISQIIVQKLELSPFTFAFQICTWTWLLGALKFRYFFVDGTILSPNLLSTFTDKPNLRNVSFPVYTVQDNFVGFFSSIAQVYFIDNPYTGAIILVGVSICSRMLSFFALFGAVIGQLTAAYLLGLPAKAIHAGLWGFNSVLTCQALGGMFFVLHGYRIWLLTFYGAIMSVLLQAAVSAFLVPAGMPTLTFPFTAICWIFCLIAGSKNLIAVRLTSISIPEDHYRRFRLSRLVKAQFKFISHLTHLSSAHDEDITWEELLKINEVFVPILMCSYVYHNDIDNLKMLVKQNINIHSTDQNLRSPLHISVSQGNMKITKWLVDSLKINVNLIDKFGGTPLFDALWHGHFHLLPFLYSRGARLPSSRSKELAFYLNAFVYEKNLDAIHCLISCGFNPNTSDYDGRNSLHLAVMTNQSQIVSYLVEHCSVWLNTADYFRQTVFDYASRLSDVHIMNYLLEQRDISRPLEKKSTENSKPLEIIVEQILENKDNIQQNENDQNYSVNMDESLLPTLFCMIAAQEDINVMDNFLKEFPQLNALENVDYDFRSAAHVAASEGRLEIIRFLSQQCKLCDFRRIMNREDRWGLSPLDEAYRNGHIDICNFINEKLSTQTDEVYKTIANSKEISYGYNVTYRLLRKWRKIFIFCTLAASGEAERINSLFARGYFLETELYADYHGRTPMHFAAANGHLNVVQVLMWHRYEDVKHKDHWGNCPIDEARLKRFDKIVDEMLKIKF
ncbi:unnamed protein product [Rotaria magnacalcarata]|uniref:Uncharacterized protein n=1 Tax=Rotaria magnacalcarata TaxID=392030 RepID=A0A820E4X7_9BILA|nr:unnamed protein product [Rotaria magnacalcarata]CAF2158184.1 unnamed protein product [Rotaria magnacalcarata]CAF4108422.1 unnamed protein product [Rotaria magnacalcarata]CAF4242952.1 unnamed protein product [Rotaria magnacalcarata]